MTRFVTRCTRCDETYSTEYEKCPRRSAISHDAAPSYGSDAGLTTTELSVRQRNLYDLTRVLTVASGVCLVLLRIYLRAKN